MSSFNPFPHPFLFLIFFFIFSSISQAIVPPSSQFKFVNEGEHGPFIVEYDGSYRVLGIFRAPFELAFYNTTPNAYTLALRMALTRSESIFRWVWEANRGNPVRENATLTFGPDGNLILADADGRVAWQTGTANKGVVELELLPNGNMVLLDSKGKFIWQSFDYPTDTLLVGQSLRARGPAKLVSRASAEDNVDGPYSLVLEPKNLAMYYKSNNLAKPLLYYSFLDSSFVKKGKLEFVKFTGSPHLDENFAFDLELEIQVTNESGSGRLLLSRPNYNATSTFLRLGLDGNLKLYTYYDKVDWGAWEVTFTLFNRDTGDETECQLPERCGQFGLCEDSQCVACPLPSGLMGWSKSCEPKRVPSCGVNDFYYYKVEGVDHFVSKFTKGDGPMKDSDCSIKCTRDCKCLGYFYHQDTSRCWLAYDLKTLTKVANSTHLAYIKAPKKLYEFVV